MDANEATAGGTNQPNILILCMDQWDTHMDVPEEVEFPALERLEAQGVSFDRAYCTVPICTPSRSTMWTGVHALHTGLWDNTNFSWINELSQDIPTIGHMLRQQGYYTAFKGKWHLSLVPHGEDALERYGFSDYQQWGEMFGSPLQGHMLDGAATFETIDWLETNGTQLDQPWLLVSSLINPHDIMFFQSDPIEKPHPNGSLTGMQTTEQRLGWFGQQWDVSLPDNFDDDFKLQPPAVQHYKDHVDLNYGQVPDDRADLWLKRRNYLINCMRRVDAEFLRILEALDRLDLWRNTVVMFMSDHGEMNGAHRMTQKGAIHFDEATIVNLTVCAPGGPQGERTPAVASLLDLAPTLLSFAGLSDAEIGERFPHLKGRNLKPVVLDPQQDGPRGSADAPGDGALICWDGLNFLDKDWALSGALQALSDMTLDPSSAQVDKQAQMLEAGKKYGAPDFSKRNYYRAVVDGQYKLVRWFSPLEYGNPSSLDDLYAHSDVTLHDLVNDPGEMENLAHADHPDHNPALVERMLAKLHALILHEIGDDGAPFDLDMFGTREVTYRTDRSSKSGVD
ncbi:MAG TPA: sulfatase-like hydrolase/transferase [Thermomicrobiales bacterium]|nr:sulfatase-like hydrolase/transferase [Thermomicrobiales bacterium]